VWLDYGSGAGFPGLVIACALADTPGARVHLVESNAKKAAFLREAIRITRASAEVYATRMENVVESFPGHPDIVTARAVAPLKVLLDHCAPLLQRGAVGMFLKGRDVEAELAEATISWTMRATLIPSLTDPASRIVKIEGLEPRGGHR
jgi:16S rRNA (guanine527-N7)-methyltransferase